MFLSMTVTAAAGLANFVQQSGFAQSNRALPPKDGHLMSQGEELKLQCGAAAKPTRSWHRCVGLA